MLANAMRCGLVICCAVLIHSLFEKPPEPPATTQRLQVQGFDKTNFKRSTLRYSKSKERVCLRYEGTDATIFVVVGMHPCTEPAHTGGRQSAL